MSINNPNSTTKSRRRKNSGPNQNKPSLLEIGQEQQETLRRMNGLCGQVFAGNTIRWLDRTVVNGTEVLRLLSKPDFESAKAVFEAALAQEQSTTNSIRGLYLRASDEKDVESYPLLDWFLTEQVEEESTVQKILGQLGHAGTDGSALLMIDRELGARTPESVISKQ